MPLPEVGPEALTPALLRAGILRNGCLLVRGLVRAKQAHEFARQIERSFKERARHDADRSFNDRFYEPFEPDPRRGVRLLREWIKSGGGVLAVDSPRLSFQMGEMFRAAGLPELVRGYLGEPPLVAADKTTLRKAEPSVRGALASGRQVHGRGQGAEPVARSRTAATTRPASTSSRGGSSTT